MSKIQLPTEIVEYILSFLYDEELEKYATENPTTLASLLVFNVLKSRILKCNFPINVGINEINHSKIFDPSNDKYKSIVLHKTRFESEAKNIKLTITGNFPYEHSVYTESNDVNTHNFRGARKLTVESNVSGRLFIEAKRDIYNELSNFYYTSDILACDKETKETKKSWYLEQLDIPSCFICLNTDINIKYHNTDMYYIKYMSHVYSRLPYIKSEANTKDRLLHDYRFRNCILTHFSVISMLPGTLKIYASDYEEDDKRFQILHFGVGLSLVKLETPIVLSNCHYTYLYTTSSVSCSIKGVYKYVPEVLLGILNRHLLICGKYVYMSGILGIPDRHTAFFIGQTQHNA